ncbi:polya polymerase [Faecalicatena orotica]|uniref:polya polymerase n=1 Tax=Faecalicatena orotica TaxID=1544 RepID=UPI00321640C1
MKKKLRGDINVSEMLKDARKCKGEVYISTDEGDILNLKSMLSQYVVVILAGQQELLKASYLVCEDNADDEIMKFYTQTNGGK